MTNCNLDSWAVARKPPPAPTPPWLQLPGQFISYVKSALTFLELLGSLLTKAEREVFLTDEFHSERKKLTKHVSMLLFKKSFLYLKDSALQ